MLRVRVDERHAATKEPAHLIPQPRSLPVRPATPIGQAELVHELIEGPAEYQLAGLRPHRFGTHPRQEQARQVAIGQARIDPGGHGERIRAVAPDVLFSVAGVSARQGAQREQPRHKAEIGILLARVNELVDLVETGEVVPRPWCGGRQGSTVG